MVEKIKNLFKTIRVIPKAIALVLFLMIGFKFKWFEATIEFPNGAKRELISFWDFLIEADSAIESDTQGQITITNR